MKGGERFRLKKSGKSCMPRVSGGLVSAGGGFAFGEKT